MSKAITPNNREIISAQSTVTGRPEYLLSTSGALNVAGSFSVTGGATAANQTNGTQKTQIVDAAGSISANVFDYANSNPLAVRLTDTAGDYVAAGAGTQYQVDSIAGATDTGTLALVVRDDVLATLTPVDGDYTQLRTTAIGRLWTSAAIDTALPTGSNVIGAVTQSGTWNITDISGTISLPTGAATAAKQPALGTAGTASADVITVQGIASMTALKVDGSAVTQPISGTVTANQGGTWNVTNVSGTVSLPTGASTSALQSTGNTSLSTIAGAVSGTEMQVDVVAALPAGTNNLGSVGTYLIAGPLVGQTTSNTTAVQLSAVSTPATNGILVQALSTNTASVFIGGSGVATSSGFELQAGQAVPFTVDNITDLYVIGSNGTDKVCWNVL